MPALLETPHRRYNALTGEWVLVSPHRTQRPWLGQVENRPPDQRPAFDPACYLCPGNTRAGGAVNPQYTQTFVFQNDFSALLPGMAEPPPVLSDNPLLVAQPVRGECRVICFSPRHDLTLPEMSLEDLIQVVHVWAEQTAALGERYTWVQIFENKGAVMGASNPHPHGQVWALDSLPNEALKEDAAQQAYYQKTKHPLLLDYLAEELQKGERVVVENDEWVVLVPFWAIWPYETLLLPRSPRQNLAQLTPPERKSLAEILQNLLTRYDNLFEISFPYSMGWHNAPFTRETNPHWQLHAHFYPPLLRSATIKKFMVGFEMLAEAQRDMTPEQAASTLRALSAVHFTQRER